MKTFFLRYADEHGHWEACEARRNLFPKIIVALNDKEAVLAFMAKHYPCMTLRQSGWIE